MDNIIEIFKNNNNNEKQIEDDRQLHHHHHYFRHIVFFISVYLLDIYANETFFFSHLLSPSHLPMDQNDFCSSKKKTKNVFFCPKKPKKYTQHTNVKLNWHLKNFRFLFFGSINLKMTIENKRANNSSQVNDKCVCIFQM